MDRRTIVLAATLVAWPALTGATDITVAGLFPNKALVQDDRGALRTISVGDLGPAGFKLMSVESDAAVFDVAGSPVRFPLGLPRSVSNIPTATVAQLKPDNDGHFRTSGLVNGKPFQFLIDTGSTLVVLSVGDADRLGIPFRGARKAVTEGVNGKVGFYSVKFDSMRVGDLTLNGVEGTVIDGNGPIEALLGMSFLRHTAVHLDGETMTLTKRP